MTRNIGRRKVVYLEDGKGETRAIKGRVSLENGFVLVETDRYRPPIMINQAFVVSIKNIL
jgi:hypothetical protein